MEVSDAFQPLSSFQSVPIILASGSPRRQQLFRELGLDFQVFVKPNIDESFPSQLKGAEIPRYLAAEKAKHYTDELLQGNFLITADTIVWHQGSVVEKPANREEAIAMLSRLSGTVHEVFTGVCCRYKQQTKSFEAQTEVSFKALNLNEIVYYVDRYQPFDKAGGYGIQEWIGYVAVEWIKGSYFNVMGLPIHALYELMSNWDFSNS